MTRRLSDRPEVRKRAYDRWHKMIQRCSDPKHPDYHRYGARGIYVCDQWRTSFDAFYACMGDAPAGMSLDREDNDGPYSPDNCRWATPLQQSWNQENAPGSRVTCPADHPYDEANTYVDSSGRRHCRACGRAATARYRTNLRECAASLRAAS